MLNKAYTAYNALEMHVPSFVVNNVFTFKANSQQGNASNTLGNEYNPRRILTTAEFLVFLITMQLAD